ncbi:hypothetical protein DXG01_015275 [Tephrocybe rancida]|nr:hypothetical protein DXG01_015275 [Tephrocybe rancida]
MLLSVTNSDSLYRQADLTDADIVLSSLDSALFPGVSSSVEVHQGFARQQAKTATKILSAVKTVISTHGATHVTIVGHSLGAALALLDGVYLPLHISGVTFTTIGYGLPRSIVPATFGISASMVFFGVRFVCGALLAATLALAAPTTGETQQLEARAITTLTAAQVAAIKPYSYYASSAYCAPANTLAWNCGANCNANPSFLPVASGGNGDSVQYCLPLVTDADFFLTSLDSTLFPGLSSDIEVHNGFGESQADSATAVLAAVQTAMSRYSATQVTIVGHSLVYLPLHLPATTTFKTYTYGSPRVGNQEFVDYVNARRVVVRVDNQDDIVPIVPGRFLGFHHVNGEKHILNSLAWVDCPGETGDHSGPYDGVHMGC